MQEVQLIATKNLFGKELRIYGTIENPLFLAKDIAEMIEHNNITHMMNMVDTNEKLTYTICNSGQGREMWFLTEDGLNEILMQSRKPIAKQFKAQVKAILKEIRLNGGYIPGNNKKELISNGYNIMNRMGNVNFNDMQFLKEYDKSLENIQRREIGDLAIYDSLSFQMLHDRIKSNGYGDITPEQVEEAMLKLGFFSYDIYGKEVMDYMRVRCDGEYTMFTYIGFRELYSYFTDNKLTRRYKTNDRMSLRQQLDREKEKRDIKEKEIMDMLYNNNK